MTDRSLYRFSVTMRSSDLAVVNCLRASSQYSQRTGNNRVPWGGTKDVDWRRANERVTFRFSSSEHREFFLREVHRLLPLNLWVIESTNDSDPAIPQLK